MRSPRFDGSVRGRCLVVLASVASAQSTKGAGKVTSVSSSCPVGNIQAVAGKPPTGGSTASLKLAKDIGDPAKPGFAPGNYVSSSRPASPRTATSACPRS